MELDVISARWSAPPRVHALTTTRHGGVSRGAYGSLNLAGHVGDDEEAVRENRRRVAAQLELPAAPVWLRQVHGDRVVRADGHVESDAADGSFTGNAGTVCAVLTADCLPLFLCDAAGTRVGLFHIGWRGLALGLARKAARLLGGDGAMAWLGPAIGPRAFEIGDDVKTRLQTALRPDPGCFQRRRNGKWLADLYALTAGEVEREGVHCGYDGSLCTYADPARFFSHRRLNPCGRMASLIWIS